MKFSVGTPLGNKNSLPAGSELWPPDLGVPPEKASSPFGQKLFLVNFAGLILFGTAVTLWITNFTDRIQDVISFLALSGGLSWFALVLRIVPVRLVESFQDLTVGVLGHWGSSLALIGLALALFAAGQHSSAVRIESGSEAAPRVAWTYSSPEGAPELFGSADGLTKTIWNAPRTVTVKAPGMPAQQFLVQPWRPVKILYPDGFSRRVLLMVPSERLFNDQVQNGAARLKIVANGNTLLSIPNYTWFSFWIGCGADVRVPRYAQAILYQESMGVASDRRYLYLTPQSEPDWRSKASWTDLEQPLDGISRIRLQISRDEGLVGSADISISDKSLEYAQVVKFDVKK